VKTQSTKTPTRSCAQCGVAQDAERYDAQGCATASCFNFGVVAPPSPEAPSRRRQALLGGAAVAVAGVVAAVGIPAWLEAKKYAGESSAIGALKAISAAQSLYRESDKDQNGVQDYGTLCQLARTQFIDGEVAAGVKDGYEFIVQPGSSPEFTWWAIARPLDPSGEQRSFFTNHTGVIYFAVSSGEGICPCEVGPFGEANPAWACVG